MKEKEKLSAVKKVSEKLAALKTAPGDLSENTVSAETLSKLEQALDAFTAANSNLASLKASYDAAKKTEAVAFTHLHSEFKLVKKQSKQSKKSKKQAKTKTKEKKSA